MIISHKNIRIFFGEKENAVDKSKEFLLNQKSWHYTKDFIQAEKLFGVHQSHGIDGIHVIKTTDQHQSILVDADFLITNQVGYGLAVTTADCVPIVLYDSVSQAVALIHAGWKGVVEGIVPKVLEEIKRLYKSDMQKIELFIGPCARQCCYEIQADTHTLFKKLFPFRNDIFCCSQNKIFLDLVSCIQYQCIDSGILIQNMYQEFAFCTICNSMYCSYRREKNQVRNVNAVVLCER